MKKIYKNPELEMLNWETIISTGDTDNVVTSPLIGDITPVTEEIIEGTMGD